MKKLFFAAILSISVAVSAFATDANKINYRIRQNFETEFRDATEVQWTLRSNFAKATFNLDGEAVEAFYNLSGTMIGTSKKITIDDLPTGAKRVFARKWGEYNVKDAIKFQGVEQTDYYISAENDEEDVVLKVSDNFHVSVFKRVKKN